MKPDTWKLKAVCFLHGVIKVCFIFKTVTDKLIKYNSGMDIP